jgi:hypothetical protein
LARTELRPKTSWISLVTRLMAISVHVVALAEIADSICPEPGVRRAGVGFWRDVAIAGAASILALTAHSAKIAIGALVFVS